MEHLVHLDISLSLDNVVLCRFSVSETPQKRHIVARGVFHGVVLLVYTSCLAHFMKKSPLTDVYIAGITFTIPDIILQYRVLVHGHLRIINVRLVGQY